MYFVIADRNVLIESLPKGGRIAELGVYTGDHAELMLRTTQCEELHLVDYWQYTPDEQNPFPDVPAHFEPFDRVIKNYMGPDPNATLEQCYHATVQRFANDPRVTIQRARTAEAVNSFEDGSFDMIYVDANHQYEFVLRDLLEYAPKLKPGGIMILNDTYESPEGRDQNLGIVGAAANFLKRSSFVPLALTSAPWSDMAITNDPSSPYCIAFLRSLLRSNHAIVGIPDNLMPNYHHDLLDLGGGIVREIPAF